MAVAADDVGVFKGRDEIPQLLSFMEEAFVGVVVVFPSLVRTYNRAGSDDEFVFGVRLLEGLLEPLCRWATNM